MRREGEGESAQCATVNAYELPSQIGNSPILPLGPATIKHTLRADRSSGRLQTEPQDMIRVDINLQVCIES